MTVALAEDEAVRAFLDQLGKLSEAALRDVWLWSPPTLGYDAATWDGLTAHVLRLGGDPDPWSPSGGAAAAVVEILEHRDSEHGIAQVVNLARVAILALHLRENEDLDDKAICMAYAPFAGAMPLIRPESVPARVSNFVKFLPRLSYAAWQDVVEKYRELDPDLLDEAVGEAMDYAVEEDVWVDALCLEPYGRLCASRAGMPLDDSLKGAFDDAQTEAQAAVGEILRRRAYGQWKEAGWATAEAAGALVLRDRLSTQQLGVLYAPFYDVLRNPSPVEGAPDYGANSAQVEGFLQAAAKLPPEQWDSVIQRWAATPDDVHDVVWDTAFEMAYGVGLAAAEAVLNAACALLVRDGISGKAFKTIYLPFAEWI